MSQPPKIGSKFKIDWQPYEVVDTRGHWTKDDRYIEMLVYQAPCATCGRLFRYATTKSSIRRKQVNRRCEQHKRSGDPVPKRKPTLAHWMEARGAPAGTSKAAPRAPAPPSTPAAAAPSYLD